MTYKENTGTYQNYFLKFKSLINQDASNYLELEIFRAINNIYIEYSIHETISKIHLSEYNFLEMYNIALNLNIDNELLVIKDFMNYQLNSYKIEIILEQTLDKIILYIASKNGKYKANNKDASNDFAPLHNDSLDTIKNRCFTDALANLEALSIN